MTPFITNSYGYDALRRLVAVTNALGRYALYNYCSCGALDSIRDAAGNFTTFTYNNAGWRLHTGYPDGYSIDYGYNLMGQLTNSTGSAGVSITNWFDNQGLLYAVSNALGRFSFLAFDDENRVTNSIDANGVSTSMTYDNLGRLLTRSYPDGGVENFGYSARGLLAYTNQLAFSTSYAYDAASRKTFETNGNGEITQFKYDPSGNLTNLIDGKNQSTYWKYDQYSRVTNKLDNLGTNLFFYSYDPDNRLTNRWSAAKANTAYKYDPVGNLTNIAYPVSSNITFAYDALNRLTNMLDGVGTTRYSYDAAGQVLSEDGPWADDTVSYTYANRLRTGLSVLAPNASLWSQAYGYDSARRLTSITSPAGEFDYQYPASGVRLLPSVLTLPNGAYITNAYDTSARLLSTRLMGSSGVLNSHQYTYNQANQRTQQIFTASDFVNYTYDNIGQLKTALGKEPGGATNRWQEQFGYAYDAAGNLNWRTNNTLLQAFNVNSLNELTTETNTGRLTVAGTTTSSATNVTVNTSNAVRYADNTFASTNQPWVNGNNTFTAVAKDSLGRVDTSAIACNLQNTNSFAYDLNGNLLSDGTRAFDYDDENELIRITVTNAWKSEFVYDGKLRRRTRREFTWQSGIWNLQSEIRYAYDGNLVIQERDANNLPQVSYTRGRDLSGSLQGAGGIGGLIARTDHHLSTINSPLSTAFYHCDGNGNITALINLSQGIAAKYLYDPYGSVLNQSGSLAEANLYRFSSKEFHPSSGLVYYLYRCYEPNLQRWLNRDPIGELGGFNLYQFIAHDPLNTVDPKGELATIWVVTVAVVICAMVAEPFVHGHHHREGLAPPPPAAPNPHPPEEPTRGPHSPGKPPGGASPPSPPPPEPTPPPEPEPEPEPPSEAP